jgi:CheY-like chemotaxis protein
MPLHIVVAEDEPELLEIMVELLGSAGHRVAGVTDGQQAVARARAGGVDVVICDLHMPGLDGTAVRTELAALTPPPRVILVTGDELAARHWTDAGERALVKPIDMRELLVLLAEYDR